jgi:hypothetical protein
MNYFTDNIVKNEVLLKQKSQKNTNFPSLSQALTQFSLQSSLAGVVAD